MAPTNSSVAALLRRYASTLVLEGADRFRVKAYRRAADTLDSLPTSVASLVAKGEDLKQLPGVGSAISAAIEQIVQRGRLPQLERAVSALSPELAELAEWPGLDPKKVRRIYTKLNISSVQELRACLKSGRIQEALGSRMAFHVRQGLSDRPRMLLWDVQSMAHRIEQFLKSLEGVTQVSIVGSARRRQETVGDLNLLVASDSAKSLFRHTSQLGETQFPNSASQAQAIYRMSNGASIDVRWTSQEAWGLNLILTTGSESHVQELAAHARSQGVELSEGALTGAGIQCGEEKSIYRGLGVDFIEPELREGLGEIAAAASGQLPELVSMSDIKGDLHMHSHASDGSNSIQEMANAAQERGLKYIAITDHSQSLKITNGLSPSRLARQLTEIDRLNANLKGFRILKGAEVDILENGSLDYPDSVLKELDLTVCSIHSRFALNKERQTERILRAMDNRYFNILGHATGRLLLKREGYEIDFDRIVERAKTNGCFFEINSSPDRLDLSDEYARRAKEAGIKIVINTDAHSTRELGFMSAGLNQARRAWLEPRDVLNTLSVHSLLKLLRGRL